MVNYRILKCCNQVISYVICINLMLSLSYQQKRGTCQEWRRVLSGEKVPIWYYYDPIYCGYSYSNLYLWNTQESQRIYSIYFQFCVWKGKKSFVRVQFSALPFHTKVFHFLKGMFNCIKPLYIIINCENRTAEVMWYKNGLSTNNLWLKVKMLKQV